MSDLKPCGVCGRQDKTFPILETGQKIPWRVAQLAYEVYAGKYGKSQTLERLAERGGFGASEMDMFYPEWRADSERKIMDWQPIETAPKDEQIIDLWLKLGVGGCRQTNCFYNTHFNKWFYTHPEIGPIPVETDSIKATHWMAIPDAPQVSDYVEVLTQLEEKKGSDDAV